MDVKQHAEAAAEQFVQAITYDQLKADLAQAEQRIEALEGALNQVIVDADQMRGLGMREEAAEAFQLIAKTARAALRTQPAQGCYCVCHSPYSSCPACVHCRPELFAQPAQGEDEG